MGLVWRFWEFPGHRGLGDWEVWVCALGAQLTRFSRSRFLLGAAWVPWTGDGVQGDVDALHNATEVLMRRRSRPGDGQPLPPHAEYADLLEMFPTLAAWMTDAQFEDGEARQGGWFCVSCRAGVWVATLKDQSEGLTLTLTAPSATLLLSLAESALIDPKAPWRADPGHQNGKPKRGK